jgi:hypothetical protein
MGRSHPRHLQAKSVKLSPKSWVRIDRLFAPGYRFLQLIIEPFFSVGRQQSNTFVVMKFFGMGSIIRLLSLCEERHIDLDKVVLVTFSANREVCRIWGLRAIFIDSNSVWKMIRSALSAMGSIVRLSPLLIVDFERGSHLSALFRTVAGWRAACRSIGFEMRSYASRSATIHSIRNLTQLAIFLKGIESLPTGGRSRVATPVDTQPGKVIVNINASQLLPERRYAPDSFAALIRKLSATDRSLMFILSGTREERSYVQQLADKLSSRQVVNAAGDWSLSQFVKELSECVLFITVDSAPLHLAASMNVATLAIWGPTQPQHFGYQTTRTFHPLSLQLPCSPCFLHPRSRTAIACRGAISCMNELPPAIIKAKAIEVMSASSSTREIIFPLKFTPEAVNAFV